VESLRRSWRFCRHVNGQSTKAPPPLRSSLRIAPGLRPSSKRDTTVYLSFVDSTASVQPSNTPAVTGHKAIQGLVENYFEEGVQKLD